MIHVFDAIWPLSLIQNVILTAGGEVKKKHGMSRKVKREENQEAFEFWKKKIKLLFFFLRGLGHKKCPPVDKRNGRGLI